MANKGGLGRGLSALISSASEESGLTGESVNEIALSMIEPNPNQPRTDIDQEKVAELADSIKRHGLLQPIIVRPMGERYQIIAGERRWRASRLAGLESVPVRVLHSDEAQSLEIALIENLQREDLNAIEAAYGYKRLIDNHGMTHSALADTLSMSRAAISNALRLLDLPEAVQAYVFEGKLTAGHARAILAVPSDEAREKLAEKVIEGGLSVRETENLARLYEGGALPKAARPVAPKSYKAVARKLRRLLETGVRVKQARGKNRIEIEFADEDDLFRIFESITQSPIPDSMRK